MKIVVAIVVYGMASITINEKREMVTNLSFYDSSICTLHALVFLKELV